MKILIIEDEHKVSAFIKRGLEFERFTVETAFDGMKGFEMAQDTTIDVIILDLMLPDLHGFAILRKLREKDIRTPIIILTSKGEIDDKIHGLNLGADDYLVKPFSFGELLARIRVLLRRSNTQSNPFVIIGDLKINMVTHEVKRGEREIELTAKEYALLEFFANNLNRAVNRLSIAEHVWKYDFDTGTNFIDVYVNRLRKKLDDKGAQKLIQTVRGYGYIMKPANDV